MIAQLAGMVQAVTATSLVVDVGGVGMRVHSTPRTLSEARVGQPTRLYTELVVREDSLTLYGFAAADEREAFAALQSVSGVGPRLALAMLAVHSPGDLATAVAAGDRAALERVPGIGAKVAARLLLELGGKLSLPDVAGVPAGPSDGRAAVVEALSGLGWGAKAAEAVVAQVAPGPVAQDQVPETLRRALQELGAARG